MIELTITAKGQITLNKRLRESLGVKPGDRLRVDVRPDGGLVILPVRRKTTSWDEIAGMLQRPANVPPLSIEEMNAVIARGWAGAPDDYR